jgi:hypothetical protein
MPVNFLVAIKNRDRPSQAIAVAVEDMRQEQTSGTAANDRHLGSRRFHCRLS